MKSIKIISATKESKDKYEDLLITKSIRSFNTPFDIQFNNQKSLAHLYNSYLNPIYSDMILVFCHDDCVIEDVFFEDKLNEAIKEFDIIGLAGIQAPITIKQPCLWHLMGPPSQYSGAVAHFTQNQTNERFMTNFGISPKRCIFVDGVFLAINTEKILQTGLKFDEKNPAKFHFYDLNFCLDANKLGLKIGTWPIWITHKSHGLTHTDPEWLKGQDYFLQKYS